MPHAWNNDTIAAIASPFGEGAIALLRVSGRDALGVADRVCGSMARLPSAYPPGRPHGGSTCGGCSILRGGCSMRYW